MCYSQLLVRSWVLVPALLGFSKNTFEGIVRFFNVERTILDYIAGVSRGMVWTYLDIGSKYMSLMLFAIASGGGFRQ
jgi:hypothetical protein